MDLNSPVLILCQISDNLHYSDALSKIQILNPSKILLPDTTFETVPVQKLIALIKDSFSHVGLIPIQRRHFNDKLGLEMITTFCSPKSRNLLQVIARKYYCLSSASALFTYLKTVHAMNFAKNCLRVEYQTRQGGMLIDSQTSARLELLYSSSEASKKFSLFSILNKCETKIGQRHLRASILEPSCNTDLIRNRQEQIKVLIENETVLESLKLNLRNFRSVDQLLKISCVVPSDDHTAAIETNIQMAILLKTCLEAVKPLTQLMLNTVSESFEEIRQLLSANVFDEILEKIDEVLQPNIHNNRLAQKHFQHLFAVKAHANEAIDSLRRLYTEKTNEIRDHVAELTERHQLPLKQIFSTKLGHHLSMKNPLKVQLPEEFTTIHQKGQNVYLTTSLMKAQNESATVLATDIIRISNTIICDMLGAFATEIDAIHYLVQQVVDLDLVQALTEVSNQENYCCPTFCQVMRIESGFHPLLEVNKSKEPVITNNVVSKIDSNKFVFIVKFHSRLRRLSTVFT